MFVDELQCLSLELLIWGPIFDHIFTSKKGLTYIKGVSRSQLMIRFRSASISIDWVADCRCVSFAYQVTLLIKFQLLVIFQIILASLKWCKGFE